MKKKSLLHLLTIMMVAMLSVGFVSCSDDDDPYDPEQSSLVGNWILKENSNYWWRFIFRKDGTGVETVYSNDGKTEITENYQFKYTYSSKSSVLIINYTTGESGTVTYTVQLTGNVLMLFDSDNSYYMFARQ